MIHVHASIRNKNSLLTCFFVVVVVIINILYYLYTRLKVRLRRSNVFVASLLQWRFSWLPSSSLLRCCSVVSPGCHRRRLPHRYLGDRRACRPSRFIVLWRRWCHPPRRWRRHRAIVLWRLCSHPPRRWRRRTSIPPSIEKQPPNRRSHRSKIEGQPRSTTTSVPTSEHILPNLPPISASKIDAETYQN